MITEIKTVKIVSIAISADFSVNAVNYMLQIGRIHHFGPAQSIYYNTLEEGKSFNEWGIVFEGGDIVKSDAQ